jgi:ABC-2 type transport system ATP-binding protein
VGLKGRENDKVKTFSHGMKQRLGLALVLLHKPSLIILDEPNTGLDPQGIIDLRHLIQELNRERGMTILFSSHILSEVQQLCTDMVVINKGKTVAQGKVAELLSKENVRVRLEVVDAEAGARILHESKWGELMSREEQAFIFEMGRAAIPEMVVYMVSQNVQIERIDYRNQLEEYFLKITQS